jgi:flagella basal body P-ring formation protein FlgA
VLGAVIDLRERATVLSAGMVTLGDLADVRDADPQRAAALREFTLFPAPAAGRSIRFTYEDLRQHLLARGENLISIELRGRRAVTVTGVVDTPPPMPVAMKSPLVERPAIPVRVSDGDRRKAELLMTAALERAFQPRGPVPSLKIRCSLEAEAVSPVLGCSPEQIHFEAARIEGTGPHALTAWWHTETGERIRVPVTAEFHVQKQTLVLKQAIAKGTILQPEDLEWVDVADEQAESLKLADVLGKEAARPLRSGHRVTAADLVTVPLVRANDIVTLVVRKPGIAVRRPGKALGAGGLHETVMVVALDDPRIRFPAVVTGYHEVTINFVTEEPSGPISDSDGTMTGGSR